MPIEDVYFTPDNDKGCVTVEVSSGYASIGQYELMYAKFSDAELKAFGKPPKKLGDDVPDLHTLPPAPEKLEAYVAEILGNYRPGPGHRQVKVTYTFAQDGDVIHETTIEGTVEKGDDEGLRSTYRFYFEDEADRDD
jgi:hypothetical protein